jgi:hypothetical protein
MTLGVTHEIKVNKSVRDPVDKKEDGFRVLITRYWPRGISKKHIAAKREDDLRTAKASYYCEIFYMQLNL